MLYIAMGISQPRLRLLCSVSYIDMKFTSVLVEKNNVFLMQSTKTKTRFIVEKLQKTSVLF
jgi:hypothetical protein